MKEEKLDMRKILCIISVALLALTACTSKDDNPVSPDAGETFSIVTLNVDGLPAYIDESC